jgi:integrase/recombinase XerD
MKQPKKKAVAPVKKKRKATRFHGTDHWITREQLAALCSKSTPFFATLWKLCAAHALRISEALALRADDIAGGFLVVKRLKGSQRTRQPLLVDLSAQVATGSYRLFPIHRSSAFLHFRRAAAEIGLHPDLRHPHVLRHSTAHWMLAGGAALNVTSQYLGHTSLASTAAYLNCSDQMASAAAASIIGRDL